MTVVNPEGKRNADREPLTTLRKSVLKTLKQAEPNCRIKITRVLSDKVKRTKGFQLYPFTVIHYP